MESHTILWSVVAWAVFGSLCYGQAKGSREAYRAITQAQQGQVVSKEVLAYQQCKKVTNLQDIPWGPHHQDKCLPFTALSDDSVGYLDCWPLEVVQVIGKDLLLRLENSDAPPVWLTGDQEGHLEVGDEVRVVGLVEVAGTKKYNTVLREKKTVQVVRLLTVKETAERLANEQTAIEDANATKEHLTKERQWRSWTSADGKYTIEAQFITFQDGRLHLKSRNGRTMQINPATLSKADQVYYRDLLKVRKRKGSDKKSEWQAAPTMKVREVPQTRVP
jgi:hypothetical protein